MKADVAWPSQWPSGDETSDFSAPVLGLVGVVIEGSSAVEFGPVAQDRAAMDDIR